MALEDYKRKRNFSTTPEPGPEVETESGHRFVVQKHRASHLHYDFRLEMEGVLKSWAVPKGPSLDPADKRLAMMVEDHPVSYVHFEGIIPPDNYGAGAVMVWDTGTWQAEGNASEMLQKGDLKFRLNGEKLKGSFVLAHMKARRPGSKGNEWLLIKHRDEAVAPGYDIDEYDYSVLTGRTLDQIASDKKSDKWESSRAAARGTKEWLTGSIAKHDAQVKAKEGTKPRTSRAARSSSRSKEAKKRASVPTTSTKEPRATKKKSVTKETILAGEEKVPKGRNRAETDGPAGKLSDIKGAYEAAMPDAIRPMLATLVDGPFDASDWLYEIKWDGYRALAFLKGGHVRLVSRNQNDLTAQFSELAAISEHVRARTAIVDGEVVAIDEEGRSSFSLMQQRTGIGRSSQRHGQGNSSTPLVYYAFDLLYLDGYDLRGVHLEQRKELLSEIIVGDGIIRYSEHFPDGLALYQAAKQRGLEGIIAKRRRGCYLEKRSREWLKIKITQRQECVVGGYTDPKGGREHFGSLILGLYDSRGRLVHVGNAGSGFTHATHGDMWQRLKKLDAAKSPFSGTVETNTRPHWVRPELVAEIKFTEWTHEGESGAVKMRAPVYEGLRLDKPPRECVFERPGRTGSNVRSTKHGKAA